MQIIIDISEETYKYIIKNGFIYDEEDEIITHAIKNGTLLPKGHGRLIDADKLKPEACFIRSDGVVVYIPAVPIMKVVNAPTIIEADGAE